MTAPVPIVTDDGAAADPVISHQVDPSPDVGLLCDGKIETLKRVILRVKAAMRSDDRPIANVYAALAVKDTIVVDHTVIANDDLAAFRPQDHTLANHTMRADLDALGCVNDYIGVHDRVRAARKQEGIVVQVSHAVTRYSDKGPRIPVIDTKLFEQLAQPADSAIQ